MFGIDGLNHPIDWDNENLRFFGLGIPLVFFSVSLIFRVLGLLPEKSKHGSRQSDILAFQVAFGAPCAYFAVVGFVICFSLFGVDVLDTEPLISNRYYGKSEFVVNYLLLPMFAYQFWNFVLSCIFVELSKIELLAHHLAVGFLQYMGMCGFVNRDSYFFIGIVEFTNVPLSILEAFRAIPAWQDEYKMAYDCLRIIFAFSFVVIRLILWPLLATPIVVDLVYDIIEGKAHSNLVVAIFVMSTFLLTALQFIWGKKIIKLAYGSIYPSKGKQS
jgi:hypothetical protein